MSTYTLLNAGRIIAGSGSIESIASVVADLGGERALIVTDRGVAGAGLITRPQSLLAAAGVEVSVIDTVPPEPDVDQVNAILAAARPMAPQVLIGIGGGSVMDVVKVVAVLLASNLSLRDLLNQAPIVRRGVPTLMIPTTAGTGSGVAFRQEIIAIERDHAFDDPDQPGKPVPEAVLEAIGSQPDFRRVYKPMSYRLFVNDFLLVFTTFACAIALRDGRRGKSSMGGIPFRSKAVDHSDSRSLNSSTRRTNSRVSAKGGMPLYFRTLPGPALYAASACRRSGKRDNCALR